VRITDLTLENEAAVRQAAELLVDSLSNGWPTMESAVNEVRDCVAPDNVARMAVEGGAVLGWIGGQERTGDVWELHPLAVRGDRQRQGIGRALVADLEEQVRARGGYTLFLGADVDIHVEESTVWTDLYTSLPERLRDLPATGSKQYEFYERCGYVIVGVVPDGKGTGNIYMAKRIAFDPLGDANRT
jgi:aminoglycoside 6'-N-acetyltransferase I